MSVITLIVILLVLGGIGWLVNTKFPGTPMIKLVVNIVLVVTAIILVLVAFGVWDTVRDVKVPHL
jgi:hypothetical protein